MLLCGIIVFLQREKEKIICTSSGVQAYGRDGLLQVQFVLYGLARVKINMLPLGSHLFRANTKASKASERRFRTGLKDLNLDSFNKDASFAFP